jgi:hypothetical protein
MINCSTRIFCNGRFRANGLDTDSPRTDNGHPANRFISDEPCVGEPLPMSNYKMTCH